MAQTQHLWSQNDCVEDMQESGGVLRGRDEGNHVLKRNLWKVMAQGFDKKEMHVGTSDCSIRCMAAKQVVEVQHKHDCVENGLEACRPCVSATADSA